MGLLPKTEAAITEFLEGQRLSPDYIKEAIKAFNSPGMLELSPMFPGSKTWAHLEMKKALDAGQKTSIIVFNKQVAKDLKIKTDPMGRAISIKTWLKLSIEMGACRIVGINKLGMCPFNDENDANAWRDLSQERADKRNPGAVQFFVVRYLGYWCVSVAHVVNWDWNPFKEKSH